MNLAIVLIFYTFIIIFDFIPLIKKKLKKEIWIYSTILIITFIVILLDSIGINVPSPALLFKTIIESFL
ncbi:MAG TPA: hypothetical protein GXZ95_04025 [Mollicutes bacterium]|nr:hypothetical protein [Mollicutes bacterium]